MAPAATILPFRVMFMVRSIPNMVHPMFVRNFMRWFLKDSLHKDEITRQMTEDGIEDMILASKCFKPKGLVMPKVLTDEELQRFKVPTLCLIGENDKIYSPQKAVQRLN
jgi:pimeloyl-ACP methyl ester carboxylesterase